ncbi:MAG: hypothetical protein HQK72_13930 [Desulfamplus sp.]|nr:hypothetical protein [Desulfamplus sp.]
MPTGMIDNVRGKILPPEWLEQIGETPDKIFQVIIKVKPNVEQNNTCINTQRDRTKNIILPHISKEIRNKVLQSLMEESDSNSDDLSIDEIKKSRSTKDPNFYNFFDSE